VADIVITHETELPVVQFDYFHDSEVCELAVIDRHGLSCITIRGEDAHVVARAILAVQQITRRDTRREAGRG
jgi:hypothetical protein